MIYFSLKNEDFLSSWTNYDFIALETLIFLLYVIPTFSKHWEISVETWLFLLIPLRYYGYLSSLWGGMGLAKIVLTMHVKGLLLHSFLIWFQIPLFSRVQKGRRQYIFYFKCRVLCIFLVYCKIICCFAKFTSYPTPLQRK